MSWLIKAAETFKDDCTNVLILNQKEFEQSGEAIIGPFATGKDFKADFNLQKFAWFYHARTHRRCLAILHKVKEDASEEDYKKEAKGVAKLAASTLSALKLSQVEFMFSSEIQNLDNTMGYFYSSFEMHNYEKSLKREKDEEEKKKDDDPRKSRMTKNVQNYSIKTQTMGFEKSENYSWERTLASAKICSKALHETRANVASPEYCENYVRKIVGDSPLVKEVRVIVGQDLEKMGAELFWGVGRAYTNSPRMVCVHYKGNPDSDEVDLALVGKGITFDTGGINIKLNLIDLMYGDKGGACAVAGALKGAIEQKVKKNVIFAHAFAENSIAGDAYRPSDILTSLSGLTVEIGNTDAEGRLVMADTATYVQRQFNPKRVTYIATLTGAIVVSLGMTTAGLFCTNDEMLKKYQKASEVTGEELWHMPIKDEHRESVCSQKGADLKNIGATTWGGSCTAAAFLERFIEKDRPWAHIDIAGPGMFSEKDCSGFGAKVLLQYIKDM